MGCIPFAWLPGYKLPFTIPEYNWYNEVSRVAYCGTPAGMSNAYARNTDNAAMDEAGVICGMAACPCIVAADNASANGDIITITDKDDLRATN